MNYPVLTISSGSTCSNYIAETIFRVAEIRQERMGERVQETLMLDGGCQRYTVRVEGHYINDLSGRLITVRKGDHIVFTGHSQPQQGIVRREDIRKVN